MGTTITGELKAWDNMMLSYKMKSNSVKKYIISEKDGEKLKMFFGDGRGYYDSWDDISEEEHELVLKAAYREEQEKKRNVNRDKRGRLNKGARLAQKDNCNAEKILALYQKGMTVREIVDQLRCSKSTVYNVLKERNNLKMYLLYMGGCTVQKVAHTMRCSEESVIFAISKFSENAVTSILEKDKHV